MLWAALHFSGLSLAVFAAETDDAGPLAIVRGNRLIAVNRAAVKAGVRPGMRGNEARVLSRQLVIRSQQPAREQALLERLAAWCYQFSSTVSIDAPMGLLLEIGRSQRLFGSIDQLLHRLEQGLQSMSVDYCLATARTAAGALLLANADVAGRYDETQQFDRAIQTLTLRALPLTAKHCRALHAAGLRTLGDLRNLPRAAVTERLGTAFDSWLCRVLGECGDVRETYHPPVCFSVRQLLPVAVGVVAGLLFVAQRLLQELAVFLRLRDKEALALQWRLFSEDAADQRFELSSRTASQDEDYWLMLLRQRFERLQLNDPVVEIELKCSQMQDCQAQTADLLPDAAIQHNTSVNGFIDKVRARLGAGAVNYLCSVSEHRPEYAWTNCEPEMVKAAESGAGESIRPLWLLSEPRPLRIVNGRPRHEGSLEFVGERERIETGWWDDKPIARDYFTVIETGSGMKLWVYRDCHGDRAWFLHGIFGCVIHQGQDS